jgi:tripartite-type tricarboxylate transporter receptor subunit TctC
LPGAGGSLPLLQLQRAEADGYTLAQLPVSVFLPPSADGKNHAAAGDLLVPVIQVSGYALGLGLIQNEPFGIGAPRGTPPEVVQRLHDAFAQAMAQENFRMS